MNDGYYVTFIIWKDYNCIKWYSYDFNSLSKSSSSYSLSNAFYVYAITPTVISSRVSSVQTDIWGAAMNIGNALATNSVTSPLGWTVIASQNSNVYHYGYFCAQDYAKTFNAGSPPTPWEIVFIIQTR